MLLSRFFDRQNVSLTHRSKPRRRPVVEALEGRQLLSTVAVTPAIQGNHIGTNAIVGNHIGTNIVGQHIGTGVVDDAVLPTGGVARKH